MNDSNAIIATYRLQLTPRFGFDRVRELIPYFENLGVSHLYLSPIFEARPGSQHGYDQTDPTRVRAELGGETAFRGLVGALHDRDMGILVDIVPNHLAAHHGNPWWREMLAGGPESNAARFFDVDWSAGKGRIILPCLGKSLEQVLADGELSIVRNDGGAWLKYYDRVFPFRGDRPVEGDRPTRELLDAQHYELTFWREGLERINYRRFFDIADLAGVRVEDPVVFEATHAGLFRLSAEGFIDGVRVDHIDGLCDPAAYLQALRRRLSECCRAKIPVILVEKILAARESIPQDWPIDGDTGYGHIAAVVNLVVDAEGVRKIRAALRPFHETALECKRLVARTLFAPELNRLASLFGKILNSNAISAVYEALVEVSSRLGVYRTYSVGKWISRTDRKLIMEACVGSRPENPGLEDAIDLIELVLLEEDQWSTPDCREFRRRWQQLTGPLAAKGIEDTALYRDTGFLALNEVGADPEPVTNPVELICGEMARRQRHPCCLNPGATHDAKRGEDARLRLAVLSWVPDRWMGLTRSWESIGCRLTDSERLLVYQTIWAVWPDFPSAPQETLGRIIGCVRKSLREAKVNTSWMKPDEPFEAETEEFVRRLMIDPSAGYFRRDMDKLNADLAEAVFEAMQLSVLLRVLAPGVADIYQGTEFLDHSLVDPDNRRPPDFEKRKNALEYIKDHEQSGDTMKFYVFRRAVQIRRWLMEKGEKMIFADFQMKNEKSGRSFSWSVAAGQRKALVSCGIFIHPASSDPEKNVPCEILFGNTPRPRNGTVAKIQLLEDNHNVPEI